MHSHYQNSKSFQQQPVDSQITAQAIYQTLIRQTPNLYPLQKFKTNKASSKQLFPDAVKYPEFFYHNLVSPGRIIKKLQGKQCIIRGFYYQLMKLAFQIQIEDKDYIEIMKNVIFSPDLMLQQNPSSPSSGKNYSDLQYKKIVAEFMQILMNQSIPNFQLSIITYPIVDQAMVKILQNVIKFKTNLSPSTSQNNSILQKLCQIFQITVVQYGNCYKFQQSDIFLYENSSTEYYIAFLNQMAEMSDVSQSSRRRESIKDRSGSKRKINNRTDSEISQENSNFEHSPKRRTRQQLNSQYQIDQTPTREPQRQVSSNLTQNKTRSGELNIQKNYRNTYGFNQVRSQQDQSQTIDFGLQKNQQMPQNDNYNRSSRDTIIYQLHKLVKQSTQSHNTNYIPLNDNYNIEITIPDSKLVKSIANPTPIFNDLETTKPYNILKHEVKIIQSRQIVNNNISPVNNSYQYQSKGYQKTNTINHEPQTLKGLPMINSAQSDQVIGYSQFTSAKMLNSLNSINSNNNNNKYDYQYNQSHISNSIKTDDFTSFIRQTPSSPQFIPPSSMKKFDKFDSYNKKQQQMIYSPKQLLTKPNYGKMPTTSTNKRLNINSNKNDQSVGTLYREFTDTKVLDILPGYVQDNIRNMRRKFRGVHSKQLLGIK